MNRLMVAASFIVVIFSNSIYGENLFSTEMACPDGEKVYFSCKTARSKLISLCATEVNSSVSSITYFFGSIDNPELTQASSSKNNFDPFKFNHYFRYGIDYFRVSFVRGGYKYEIYRDYDIEEMPTQRYGIIVSSLRNPGRDIEIKCHGEVTESLSRLSSVLRCDKDSALGCAN